MPTIEERLAELEAKMTPESSGQMLRGSTGSTPVRSGRQAVRTGGEALRAGGPAIGQLDKRFDRLGKPSLERLDDKVDRHFMWIVAFSSR